MTLTSARLIRPAACLVSAAVLLAAIPLVFGSPRPMLRIEWRGASDPDRLALERRWRLTDLDRPRGTSRFYAMRDTSESTLREIVTNPSVADTDGIDRGDVRIPDKPTLTEPVGGWLAGAPAWLAGLIRLFAYLLLLIAVVLLVEEVQSRLPSAALGAGKPSPTSLAAPSTTTTVVLACAFFAGALIWRFLTFTGFSNDHYVHVALAQQVLLGDRPVRDFIDQGWPLMYLLSAAGWRLAGGTLGAEWTIASTAFAVAAACTVIAAARLSRSLVIAAAVALVEVLILPRSYSYPKIATYAVAAWGLLALADRPSRGRIVTMAAIIAIAFLLRHDHGLFIGIGAAACVAMASRRDGWRTAVHRVAMLTAVTLLFLIPWMIFVSVNGGLLTYLQSGLEFSRGESEATSLEALPVLSLSNPLATSERAAAWLFWLFWALPAACGTLAIRRAVRGDEGWRGEAASVIGLTIIAVLVNATFLRQALEVRVPDAIVPAVLLAAWGLGLAWARLPEPAQTTFIVRLALLVVLVFASGAVAVVADLRGQVDDTRIAEGPNGIEQRAARVRMLLASTHRQNLAPPSRYATALMPFVAYLDRCSTVADRLILTDQYPEVLVMAGRKFAGDGVVLGSWFTSAAHQDRTLRRLHDAPALFVVLLGDVERFRQRFSLIADDVQREYASMATVPVEGTGPIDIMVMRNRRASGRDADTGWPCFR